MTWNKITFTFFIILILVLQLSAQQEAPDALLAFRESRYEEAIRITNNELAITPNNIDSHVVQGWSLLSLGRWSEAAERARTALAISTSDHRIISIMAEAQYGLGNYLTALQYMQDYIAMRPDGYAVNYMYELMGRIHILFEEYHSADIALSASVYYEPRNGAIWERLGFAREQAGSLEAAREAYEQAIELSPGLDLAHEALKRLN